ncbi:adenylosuccinate synthetase, putative [Trypanosoma brucei gambiense DAL972]|uniref:Adenylosuccinate synthetase n=2 Tax=Trypanosoma brucei TaxID=5691 RepID=PURA_TRYB9|nr:adenylosuccinate synthetase, putative [Trypanosoma brucei gambiense DAL972]D0A6J7.1 RecName: Full=Adenylosuccinate synthetase; Short=AMPSase; Short=AdSS; AltName: Full=IMP--aspartate ligase [Trypanosoma brucei gambiense DAL972]RHW67949.1 adenylosuccinate synthetase [Trypanosoma brucei equiperdum]CBH17298.1 adenylosuccinate synthetase, putative [Trypanosoma brucei gambiense DAL972]|eukprot:XP_011779562.1 adenylosuccinate synthetase, putative [Trypanosoma brucei gambiense DAL972]
MAAAPSATAPKHNYTLGTNASQLELYKYLKTVPPIPELRQAVTIKKYEEASVDDTLYPLIDEHQIIMVVGAFFGDEGKGKTVDAVARHPACTCVARVNSGENAGHTVFDDIGRKYVFNLAPSSLLTPNTRNYVSSECVMDPISFMEREIGQFIKSNMPYKDKLFVGNVFVVTPYHKLLDLLGSAPNSSTLKGMSPIHASKVTKRGIRLDHIFNDEGVLRARLAKDMDTYYGLLKVKGLTDKDVVRRCEEENADGVERVPGYVVDFARAENKIDYLVKLYTERVKNNKDFPRRCDVTHELRAALARGEKLLLEGPQSYWLSNAREKFWESTTSADTTAGGLLASAQFNFQRYKVLVINVHKAPGSSRVGIGANPSSFVPQDYYSAQDIKTLEALPKGGCVDFDKIQNFFYTKAFNTESKTFNGIYEPLEYEDATGKYNIGVAMSIASARHHGECGAVTKKPRVCGFFDCVLHFEVNAVQGPYLSISAVDRGDDYDRIGITIAYVYYDVGNKMVDANGRVYKNGDIIKAGDPVPCEMALYHCYPIVKVINGWKGAPIAASKRRPNEPLPKGVCEFIANVEFFTGAKVISIGNGPRGSDIIYLKQ